MTTKNLFSTIAARPAAMWNTPTMIIIIPAKTVKPLAHLGEESPRPAPVSCCALCSAMLGTPSAQRAPFNRPRRA
ncbi:hypothetical protein GCM10010170_021480 [Dactylosporangium salmoneum]|uniref:Uncharacterized protein n=1 Tax=Dactylosporangium salmoneum TaxID=53361 RepID=A0ABN3FWW4_9ACTN